MGLIAAGKSNAIYTLFIDGKMKTAAGSLPTEFSKSDCLCGKGLRSPRVTLRKSRFGNNCKICRIDGQRPLRTLALTKNDLLCCAQHNRSILASVEASTSGATDVHYSSGSNHRAVTAPCAQSLAPFRKVAISEPQDHPTPSPTLGLGRELHQDACGGSWRDNSWR